MLSTALFASPAFATHSHRAPASGHTTHKTHKASKKKKSRRVRGQQAIESARVMEIQQALIREHYMSGDATGSWDSSTQDAMRKFQSDQGWQTKLTPDSRALKKLGLGPDYSEAINAKDASFNDPPPVGTIPSTQAAGFTAASGASQ